MSVFARIRISALAIGLAAASGDRLTLASGLAKPRWGVLQYVTSSGKMSLSPDPSYSPPASPAPSVLDERAAVGNLSRNIVIQGADDSAWQNSGFGAHVMIMELRSKVVIDSVELRRVADEERARESQRVDGDPFEAVARARDDEHPLVRDDEAVGPRLPFEPVLADRLDARGHREVDEPAHPAGHLDVHHGRRVEVEDLGGDADLERRRVETPDQAGPGHPGDKVRPVRREVIADRHDGTEPGHHGTAGRIRFRRQAGFPQGQLVG